MSENPVYLVECKQRRNGGSDITMADNRVIKFRPDAFDRHIGEVSDPDHLQRLMSIPEGFSLIGVKDTTMTALLGATTAPAPAAVVPAPDPVPEPAPSPAPVPEQTQAPVAAEEPAAQPPADLSILGLDDLRAVFEMEVGRKPHHNHKADTLIAQIVAIRAERAKTGA